MPRNLPPGYVKRPSTVDETFDYFVTRSTLKSLRILKESGEPPKGHIPAPPSYRATTTGSGPVPSVAVIEVQNMKVGTKPENLTCPYCQEEVVTVMDKEPTVGTHIACLALSVLCLWCIAPFLYCSCTDCLLAKTHYCPKCGSYLGQKA